MPSDAVDIGDSCAYGSDSTLQSAGSQDREHVPPLKLPMSTTSRALMAEDCMVASGPAFARSHGRAGCNWRRIRSRLGRIVATNHADNNFRGILAHTVARATQSQCVDVFIGYANPALKHAILSTRKEWSSLMVGSRIMIHDRFDVVSWLPMDVLQHVRGSAMIHGRIDPIS